MKTVALVLSFLVAVSQLGAETPKSLLPAFGTDGAEFTTKAQSDHVLRGWLPADWKDNTEWASVSATYTKLTDPPAPSVGAVRIKVEKVDEGQLQLTTYQGIQDFKQGKTYKVAGWMRSPDRVTVKVGARQTGDPYEMYHEQDISTQAEWKPFAFEFKPAEDIKAFIMFVVTETGTIDIAGITLTEVASGEAK
jgi:hypothetical protein